MLSPADFKIDSLVQRKSGANPTFEYNCHTRRIFPWNGTANTKRPITEFGMILVELDAGTEIDAHKHDEEESFIIISGKGDLEIEGQTTTLAAGDVVYIPRFWNHQMKNPYGEALKFVDTYWDWQGRSEEEYMEEANVTV